MSAANLTQAEKEAILRARKKARLQDPNRLKFIIGEEKALSKPTKSTAVEVASDQTITESTETNETAPKSASEAQGDVEPAVQRPQTITVQHHTHDLVTPLAPEDDGEPPVPTVRIRKTANKSTAVGAFSRGLLSEDASLAEEAAGLGLGLESMENDLQALFSPQTMMPRAGAGGPGPNATTGGGGASMLDQAQMAAQLMSLFSAGNNNNGNGGGLAGLFGSAFGGGAPAVPVSRWANLGSNLLISTFSIILAILCSFGLDLLPTFTSMNLILAFIIFKIFTTITKKGGASGLFKLVSGPINLFSLFAHFRSASGLWDEFVLFLFCFIGTYSFLHLV